MVDVTQTTQYVREAPEIEAYKLGLYQDAQKYIKEMQAAGVQPPARIETRGAAPAARRLARPTPWPTGSRSWRRLFGRRRFASCS